MTADRTRAGVLGLVAEASLSGPVPRYRSEEWLALTPTDLRRLAAVWQAAEAWHYYWTEDAVTDRVREQVAADRAVVLARVIHASHDVAGDGSTWRRLAGSRTHDELEQARRRRLTPDQITQRLDAYRDECLEHDRRQLAAWGVKPR